MPDRRCAACGKVSGKEEFIRIARTKDGAIRIDMTGKAPGRGAYLCRDSACIEKAVKKQSLNRSFHAAVPEEIYDGLGNLGI
ncbi:MAG: YlxR family protein [Lachnospiraceae bacterium]|nr:YlxR family protein [Lachnospiraceae bacterium]